MRQSLNENNAESALERVKIVPVEELIPGIKPDEKLDDETDDLAEGEDYHDHFIDNFVIGRLGGITRSVEALNILKKRFEGQVLVDLGPGLRYTGYMIALLLGCKGYVGVDKHHSDNLRLELEGVSNSSVMDFINSGMSKLFWAFTDKGREYIGPKDIKLIPASVVSGDMLHFLRRLPDKSVSVLASGIDASVIRSDDHREKIGREIVRTLRDDGVYAFNESDIPVPDLVMLEPEDVGDSEGQKSNMEILFPKYEDVKGFKVKKTG